MRDCNLAPVFWEQSGRAGVGRCGQTRQYAVIVAFVVPLSCDYALHQRPRRLVLLVVVLDVVGSRRRSTPASS